jgi:transposase
MNSIHSVFVARLKEFKNQWTFDGICVADSASYTAENLSAMAGMKCITQVPLSIKSAREKISAIEDKDWESAEIKGYKIAAITSEYANIKQRWIVIETRLSVIEAEQIAAGRFILATNILDTQEVSDRQILSEYKAQQSNERGFRFIKDPLFFTSSYPVKNPERVEAIGMIMGLCLLVYTLAQRKLRQHLEATNEGVRNQVKKLTNKPTMRWIFQMFQAVHLVTVNGDKQVSNLTCVPSRCIKAFRTVWQSVLFNVCRWMTLSIKL